MKASASATALRWLVAALLLLGGLGKLAQPTQFLTQIFAYDLPLPEVLARLVAVVLPWLEVLVGVALLTRQWRTGALWWSLVLFSVFAVATGQAWVRGLDISCGCFDVGKLGAGEAFARWMEHVGVACVRAVLLAGAVLFVASKENRAAVPQTANP